MAPGEGVGVSVMGEVQTEVVLTTTISYLSWLGTHSGFAGVESQAQEFKVLTNQPAIFGLAQAVMREQHTWLSSGFRPKAPDKAKRTSLPTERAVRQVLSKLLHPSPPTSVTLSCSEPGLPSLGAHSPLSITVMFRLVHFMFLVSIHPSVPFW